MVGAGLLARNAVARGLTVAPTVKTSLAPGSKAVTAYLEAAGLMAPLEQLGFALAGYGCTTCIGNSGPLDEPIANGDRGERPRRRGGPLGQPQLRGPDPSPRPGQLPRLAAARRRVRPRRPGRHRPDDRAARHRIGRTARSCSPTSGRRPTRSGRSSAARSTRSCSGARTPSSSTATIAGGRCRSRPATATTGTRARRTSPSRRSSTASPREPAPVDRHRRRPGARRPRRLGHDRPHLAGRLDRALVARRATGSRSATSRRSSSTRTAPGAGTTR